MFNFFKRKKNKKYRLKLIGDRDLEIYLKKLGVYDNLINNKLRCKFCGDIITMDTIEAILPIEDEIYYVCSRPKCFYSL